MRIAMLTNNYKPFIGGVPISIERLSDGLRNLGHEVYIFAPSYENEVPEENIIRYKSLKKKYGGVTIPNIMDINIEKKFRELKIDVIHVHHPVLIGWWAYYLGKKYDIPVVFTYHTRFEQYLHWISWVNKLENIERNTSKATIKKVSGYILSHVKGDMVRAILRKYLNSCDLIFAPSNNMKDILEEMGVEKLIEVLPTGLNNNFFNEDKERSQKIRETYIGDKTYLFSVVSRLGKEKNLEFLINGLKQLKLNIGNCFKTMIIGDGPIRSNLENMVIQLGLEENVDFLRSIPNEEIKYYLGASDLFLFSSKSETQGIVLLEAMAARNPVVAIKASGVNDIIVNGENGYATEESIDDWVEKIAYLINNKEEMERLSLGAYETAYKYTEDKIALEAQCCYKEVVN